LLLAFTSQAFAAPAPKPVVFHLQGRSFSFVERNVSLLAGCPPRFSAVPDIVGLVLLDRKGRQLWSINVTDLLASLKSEMKKTGDCLPETSHARIEGVAVVGSEAHFAVSILHCGGSCAGYDVQAFRFDGRRVRKTFESERFVDEIRFALPTLTLYESGCPHESCPWVRTVYRWRQGKWRALVRSVYPTPTERNPWRP
jgi:hypothetical protein